MQWPKQPQTSLTLGSSLDTRTTSFSLKPVLEPAFMVSLASVNSPLCRMKFYFLTNPLTDSRQCSVSRIVMF